MMVIDHNMMLYFNILYCCHQGMDGPTLFQRPHRALVRTVLSVLTMTVIDAVSSRRFHVL